MLTTATTTHGATTLTNTILRNLLLVVALSLAVGGVGGSPVPQDQPVQVLEEGAPVVNATAAAAAAVVPDDEQHHNYTLAARGEPITGDLHCGHFANGNHHRALRLVEALSKDPLREHEYPLTPFGCNRVNCWDTTGVYVCNDNSHRISVTGKEVVDASLQLLGRCCRYTKDDAENHDNIMSGQQFTQYGWNVVIGYADCNHPVWQKPHTIGGWGVNPGSCSTRFPPAEWE